MPSQPVIHLTLTELTSEYSIVRFPPTSATPDEFLQSATEFVSISRTATELSVIAPVDVAGGTSRTMESARSDGWRCLRVETSTFPTETPGIVAAVVGPLAEAGVSVFAVASFDTDHVLVQDIAVARAALTGAGHRVVGPDQTLDGPTPPSSHNLNP